MKDTWLRDNNTHLNGPKNDGKKVTDNNRPNNDEKHIGGGSSSKKPTNEG